MQVTRKQVMKREELIHKFKENLESHYLQPVAQDCIQLLYKELVGRVLNTMANSFLNCQNTLERIRNNKGVDAQVSLRDQLKVYAGKERAKLVL